MSTPAELLIKAIEHNTSLMAKNDKTTPLMMVDDEVSYAWTYDAEGHLVMTTRTTYSTILVPNHQS